MTFRRFCQPTMSQSRDWYEHICYLVPGTPIPGTWISKPCRCYVSVDAPTCFPVQTENLKCVLSMYLMHCYHVRQLWCGRYGHSCGKCYPLCCTSLQSTSLLCHFFTTDWSTWGIFVVLLFVPCLLLSVFGLSILWTLCKELPEFQWDMTGKLPPKWRHASLHFYVDNCNHGKNADL